MQNLYFGDLEAPFWYPEWQFWWSRGSQGHPTGTFSENIEFGVEISPPVLLRGIPSGRQDSANPPFIWMEDCLEEVTAMLGHCLTLFLQKMPTLVLKRAVVPPPLPGHARARCLLGRQSIFSVLVQQEHISSWVKGRNCFFCYKKTFLLVSREEICSCVAGVL